jgi:uncharacterized RDD family membrane protein YckC
MTEPLVERTATSFPVAGLERRFYAFVVDRVIAWSVIAAACWAAYQLFWSDDGLWPGVALVAGVVVLVWVVFAVALGASGATPGKAALGLRAVHFGTGTPIGVDRALLRGLVLGVATIPTFGIGLATLAWTAVMDPGHRRRGWHDQVARSIVVDVRPAPVATVEDERGPRHVVNLTAMRLVPATPSPPVPATPRRTPTPPRTQPPTPVPGPVPGPVPDQVRYQAPEPATPTPVGVPEPNRTARRAPVVVPSPEPTTAPRWLLAFDTGERVAVDGLVLVGRRPEGRPGEGVRHLVALPSQDMSLSKTHAQVGVAGDGALVVMDRGSTNGSVLTRQGVSRPLSGGKPATLLEGDLVRFGDRSMEVSREG